MVCYNVGMKRGRKQISDIRAQRTEKESDRFSSESVPDLWSLISGLRAFSLVELLVTLSIMGLLLITIVPILGRFGRDNTVKLATQTVREALLEAQNYAISPNVSICPARGATPLPKTINSYALFAPSSTGGMVPKYDATGADPTPDTYRCGIVDKQADVNLVSNQYAIVARHLDYDAVSGAITKEYIMGVVRVGYLDNPSYFAVPIQNKGDRSVLIGYDSPSGRFVENILTDKAGGFDYIAKDGDVIFVPAGSVATGAAAGQYSLFGLASTTSALSSTNATTSIFINRTSGQITSTGIAPSGFN